MRACGERPGGSGQFGGSNVIEGSNRGSTVALSRMERELRGEGGGMYVDELEQVDTEIRSRSCRADRGGREGSGRSGGEHELGGRKYPLAERAKSLSTIVVVLSRSRFSKTRLISKRRGEVEQTKNKEEEYQPKKTNATVHKVCVTVSTKSHPPTPPCLVCPSLRVPFYAKITGDG